MKNKPEYKWVILFTCCLMVLVCLGFCSSNKGLYLSAITEALGKLHIDAAEHFASAELYRM